MIVFLGLGFLLGFMVYRVSMDAGWHWGFAVGAGLVPVAFSAVLGVLGLVISALFVASMYKATA